MTDLKVQYTQIKEELDPAIQRVMESGRFILGSEVETFEGEMASYCGTGFAIGVASGTDALVLSLIACGVKPGDEVITTPFTFMATAEAISRCGALPVFVDIDPKTYNIDPNHIEMKITPRTRALIPVHLYGQPADMEPILELSKKYYLKVVEDCAQALSAEYKGKKVGSIGDAGCFSFFPAKNLGAFGDGGMVATNDPHIAEITKILRQHGSKKSYYHIMHGLNSRLDAIQAAILRVKLKHLDNWSKLRRDRVLLYNKLLSKIDGIGLPYSADPNSISANYYTIRLLNQRVNRDELRKFLALNGIETAVYYPLSLHLQEVYNTLSYKYGDFPESERAQEEVLSLPMFPEITQEQVEEVVNRIHKFFNR